MPKTIQIRDIDDEIYAGLRKRAAEEEVSVPELLRAEATRLARSPSITSWLASTRRRSSSVGTKDVLGALDELRDADR
jgi:antitoxin FitA